MHPPHDDKTTSTTDALTSLGPALRRYYRLRVGKLVILSPLEGEDRKFESCRADQSTWFSVSGSTRACGVRRPGSSPGARTKREDKDDDD